MILSVHIPKTAGTTFGGYLQGIFGPRLVLDYGDLLELAGEENVRFRQGRRDEMLLRSVDLRENADAIHGHYHPAKYRDVFAEVKMLTFVRDPYQHAMSSYFHGKRSMHDNAASQMFRARCMSVADLVETFPDHQSSYLEGLELDEFELIGISEDFERSVALFKSIFAIATPWSGKPLNANPAKSGPIYEVPADVRRAVDTHRSKDIALYRRARERFAELVRRHDV